MFIHLRYTFHSVILLLLFFFYKYINILLLKAVNLDEECDMVLI